MGWRRKVKGARQTAAVRVPLLPFPRVTLPLLLMVLVVFGALLLIQRMLLVEYGAPTRDDSLNRRQATVIAELVDGVVTQSRIAVRVLAHTPGLDEQVKAADFAARVRLERSIRGLIPGARALVLVPAGNELAARSGEVALGYAAQEMVAKARAGTPAQVEAHRVGESWQLNLVDVTPGGTRVLLVLDLAALQQVLDGLDSPNGYVEVQQQLGPGTLVVARRGDEALKKGEPAASRSLQVEGWRVAYWAPGTVAGPTGEPVLLGTLMVGALVLMVVLLVLVRRLQTHLDHDLGRLMGWVEQTVHGKPETTPEGFRLAQVRSAVQGWADSLRRASSEVRAPAVPAPSAPMPEPETVVAEEVTAPAEVAVSPEPEVVDPSIFRAYDIRGVVGKGLTPGIVYRIGRALGTEVSERGEAGVIVGRDGRLSGPELAEALIQGLRDSGQSVIDLGQVPTPALYFATHQLPYRSGVMVTGSHNPPDYNGLKIVVGGETLSGEAIQSLRQRVESGEFATGSGSLEQRSILNEYLDALTADVGLARPLKVVVDCGNGTAGLVAPRLFQALGCEVSELYCEVDGSFPNHHPDPSQPQNLQDLIQVVRAQEAELGIAFDGDGDRIGVVTANGEIIWPDRLMMLFAADLLTRHPGADVIFDVKCSRHLGRVISEYGGRPVMYKTGHSLLKAKLAETGALLAGEMSGHIFFKERWFGFDDGLYAAVRLLEILSLDPRPVEEILGTLPGGVATPELHVEIEEAEKPLFMERLLEGAPWPGGKANTIDGLRVDFADGWGLVRPSNTTPHLVVRFEADDAAALTRIQALFRERLLIADPLLELPF